MSALHETPAPEPTAAPGRDTRGRFTAGNGGGPGNPFARQVAALRAALVAAVAPDDMAAIAAALVERAKGGDVAAARLVLSYLLGKPAPPVDPDRLDADEWQAQKATAGMLQELPGLMRAPAPDMALAMVRAARPAVADELGRQLGDALAHPEKFQPGDMVPAGPDDAPPSANGPAGPDVPAPPSANGACVPGPQGPGVRHDPAHPSPNGKHRSPRGRLNGRGRPVPLAR